MNGLLSREFLKSIGIDLDETTYVSLSQHYEQTLHRRVIESIVELLDESQTQKLTELQRDAPQSIPEWLVNELPELDEVIEDEIAILLGEIAESVDSVV